MYLKFICLCMVMTRTLAAPHTNEVPPERQQPTVIPIISLSAEYEPDGKFKYSYETGNGIKREETAYDKELPEGKSHSDCSNEGGEDDESGEIHVQKGSYSYTAPDGSLVSVRYIADENGFQPINERIQYRSRSSNTSLQNGDKEQSHINEFTTKKPSVTETQLDHKAKAHNMKFGDRFVHKNGKNTEEPKTPIKSNENLRQDIHEFPENINKTEYKSPRTTSMKNTTVNAVQPTKINKNSVSGRENNFTNEKAKPKEMLSKLNNHTLMGQIEEKGKVSSLESQKPTNTIETPIKKDEDMKPQVDEGQKSEKKEAIPQEISDIKNQPSSEENLKKPGNNTKLTRENHSNKVVPPVNEQDISTTAESKSVLQSKTPHNTTTKDKNISRNKTLDGENQNKNDKKATQKILSKEEITPDEEKGKIPTKAEPASSKNSFETSLKSGKNTSKSDHDKNISPINETNPLKKPNKINPITMEESSQKNMRKLMNNEENTLKNEEKVNNNDKKSIHSDKNQGIKNLERPSDSKKSNMKEETSDKESKKLAKEAKNLNEPNVKGQNLIGVNKNSTKKGDSSEKNETTPVKEEEKKGNIKPNPDDKAEKAKSLNKLKKNEATPENNKDNFHKENSTTEDGIKPGKDQQNVHKEEAEHPTEDLEKLKQNPSKHDEKPSGVDMKKSGGDKGNSRSDKETSGKSESVPDESQGKLSDKVIVKSENNERNPSNSKREPNQTEENQDKSEEKPLINKPNITIETPNDTKKFGGKEKNTPNNNIIGQHKESLPGNNVEKINIQTEKDSHNNESLQNNNKTFDKKEPNPLKKEDKEMKSLNKTANIENTLNMKAVTMAKKVNSADKIEHPSKVKEIPDENTKNSTRSDIIPDKGKENKTKKEEIPHEEEKHPNQNNQKLSMKEEQPNQNEKSPAKEMENARQIKSEKEVAHAADVAIKAAGVAENAANKAVKAADVAESAADAAQKAALETEKIAEAAKQPGNHTRELVIKAAKEHAKLAENAAEEAVNAAEKADKAAEDAKDAAKAAQTIVKSVQTSANTIDTQKLLGKSESLVKNALNSAQDAGSAAENAKKELSLTKNNS